MFQSCRRAAGHGALAWHLRLSFPGDWGKEFQLLAFAPRSGRMARTYQSKGPREVRITGS